MASLRNTLSTQLRPRAAVPSAGDWVTQYLRGASGRTVAVGATQEP